MALLSSSSLTAVTLATTIDIPGISTTLLPPVTQTIYTTVQTLYTTVTQTVPVIIGQPTPSYPQLTTYTTAFTTHVTVTATLGPPAPTVTVIEGGGGTGGVTIGGVIYELWMYFLCPSKNCTPWREWLTFIPSVAAGWVVGALALLLALALLAMGLKCGGLEYVLGFLALVLVCICLFLRAALKGSEGDLFTMYKTAVWFNYFAPVLLAMLLAQLVFRLIVHLDNTLCGAGRALVGFVYFIGAVLFALLTAAVILMFDRHSLDKVHSGMQCLQGYVVIVLVLGVVLLLAAAWASSNDVDGHHMGHVIIIGVCSVLLVLWGCFMTARAFLVLTDAGRYSEALWYIFNIVPLLLIAVVLLALNAPTLFTFCHCQVNSCPACNPHVRYTSSHSGGPRHAYTATHDREANVTKYYM